jgi:hypothetical protein
MFRVHARTLLFALALLAVAGSSMLPGVSAAAAASISTDTPPIDPRHEAEGISGDPTIKYKKIVVEPKTVGHEGKKTTYLFYIRAVGGSFPDVTVTSRFGFRRPFNGGFGFSHETSHHFGAIAEGGYRGIVVTCNPPEDAYCDFAFAAARDADDTILDQQFNQTDGYQE